MKPTQLYLFILSILLLTSCFKKEINIPTSAKKGIQKMTNYSEIWMFLQVKENDTILKLNDHNLIGATNWVFNIDKNHKLKDVLPKVQDFQEKRAKRAEKNKNEFKNYLSYADTIQKTLSFIDISNIQFHFNTLQSKKNIIKNQDYYKTYNNVHLSFELNAYFINENEINKVDFFKQLDKFLVDENKENMILLHLNFNQELNYQEYLNIKTQLIDTKKEQIMINQNEYIF